LSTGRECPFAQENRNRAVKRYRPMKLCRIIDLGQVAYGEAAALQQRLVAARKIGAVPDLLLFCEHPHVITLGRNGKRENLRVSEDLLIREGVEFHHTNRGGDITYHGPGQIVGYPILDLNGLRRDVGWYVRQLEQCMIQATSRFGVRAFRVSGCTGVWVQGSAAIGSSPEGDHCRAEEKLASIGVHISRWVTSHGFAYNVSSDLRFFDLITPCGIPGCRITSLEKLLGNPVSRAAVVARLGEGFSEAFGLELTSATARELSTWLQEADPMPVPAC
jgi:lipoyl(octanoyl) transferase